MADFLPFDKFSISPTTIASVRIHDSMKRLLVLLAPLFFAGCATVPPPKFEVSGLEKSQTVVLQDLHPGDENKSEIFSYLLTSERYGIYRTGAINTNPSAMRLLQHRAYERLGERSPLTIKVYHFAVYRNVQGSLRAGALGSVLGPIGAVIASSSVNNDLGGSAAVVDPSLFTSTSGDNEWKRAVMSRKENPTNGAAFVIWLDVDINGKRVFVRDVSPIKVPEGQSPYSVALESTYDFLLKQF